jgi:hypothetical protein
MTTMEEELDFPENLEFRQYRRISVAELRPVEQSDIGEFDHYGCILIGSAANEVSISDEDRAAGSPKIGDMIARNPKNHLDQWLVAERYFKDNFEAVT